MYTLPIGYYPALSDADLDRILVDNNPDTVEFMITPADHASLIDIKHLSEELQDVERIDITASNTSSWTTQSEHLKHLSLQPEAGRPGGVQPGQIIWLAKRKKHPEGGWTRLGRLRIKLKDQLVSKGAMTLPKDPHFLWITEFPLFTKADDDKDFLAKGRWSSSHHPFTAPMHEDIENLRTGVVDQVRGQHYDLVLNGMEIGGGSVRIHDATLQEYILKEVLEVSSTFCPREGQYSREMPKIQ